MELTDLVNFAIIILSRITLLNWLTLLLGLLIVTLTVLLFWIYFYLLALVFFTMAFFPLANSDRVLVSVFTDFSSYLQNDVQFHRIAYDYSRADWDGPRDHLGDVPWEDMLNQINITDLFGNPPL